MSSERRVTETEALRAMSHPLRLRLYYALVIAGSATATALATQVDESVSLVSYHLRELARYGYVEENDERAGDVDGRERWWRPTSVGFVWSASDFEEGSDGAAAVAEATRQMDAHHASYKQVWLDDQAGWDQEWRDAAITTDNPLLRMTPGELLEFGAEYVALTQRWRRRLSARKSSGRADRRREQIMIVMQAFPFRP